MMQLAFATIVTVAYLVVQLVAMPYRHASDNLLALACSTNLVFLFLGSLFFKYSSEIHARAPPHAVPSAPPHPTPPTVALRVTLTCSSCTVRELLY